MAIPSKVLPKQEFHQHWCIDFSVIQALVQTANLHKDDIVVEIGPGTGILTKELAKKCQKVIAIEIDTTLKPVKIKNVEYVVDNALNCLEQRKDFTKIVANLPYQLAEPLLHYLCLHPTLTVMTVPQKFARLAQRHPIFSAFLNIEIIQSVAKEAFDPKPKVESVIAKITKNITESDDFFICRKLYLQRDKKLKNGLRDTLIDYYKYCNKPKLTKKRAEDLILTLDLEEKWLEYLIKVIPVKLYKEIVQKVSCLHF